MQKENNNHHFHYLKSGIIMQSHYNLDRIIKSVKGDMGSKILLRVIINLYRHPLEWIKNSLMLVMGSSSPMKLGNHLKISFTSSIFGMSMVKPL